ncbi:CocE/NonD family hydrolase [Algoriphagus sp.]|uniref:CocE/NonD family hydrolase n=1 Tax=Algoriphagus sp. TaxID=1872435 RepID=UPI0025DAC884|nr:CocE/NonD family hydrolase [Algoriphagus sp.]
MKLLFTGVLLLIFSVSFGQTSVNEISLESGDYVVGFRHYLTQDSSRTYQRIYDWNNEYIPRPIPVSIWYPAEVEGVNQEPLKVLDYLRILKEEEEWEYLPDDWILNWFYYANTEANQVHLLEETKAYSDMKPKEGKFPVIVYAPSYQASSIENFTLCEMLASHGYIVISSPSRGADTRYFEGGTAKDMETQARDIEFLMNEIGKYPQADLNQIGTMGFSFGGLSHVLTQMRNEGIKAVVSLDGSIKYQFVTLQKSPFFDLKKFDVPFIHMAQKEIPDEILRDDGIDPSLNTDFEFYDSINSVPAYKLQFHKLTHTNFSSLGVLFAERDPRQDMPDSEIMESFRLVSTYTLNFLNAYLKNDSEGKEFLSKSPKENQIKDELISINSKFPAPEKYTFRDFNEQAANQEYKNLKLLYEQILTIHPSFQLPEGNLNNLGLQLLFNPKTSNFGINVFLLAIELYPNSSNLFDSLAEAYLFVGEKEKAKENFAKSLELDPNNQNAIDRLKELNEAGKKN